MKQITAKHSLSYFAPPYMEGKALLVLEIENGPKATIGKKLETHLTREQILEALKYCNGTRKEDALKIIEDLQAWVAKSFR